MKLIYYKQAKPNFGDDLNAFIWPTLAPSLFLDGSDAQGGFVGIGTIIGMPCGDVAKLNVFSSGLGNDPLSNWAGKEVQYHCVRGPISARGLGLDATVAITDGGILTPLVEGFPAAKADSGPTVIIPHFETLDFPGWDDVERMTGFELVDPKGTPQAVIAKIAGAGLVLTESLHGAILADTYGVPWIAFCTSGNFGVTKWIDWTRSVGRDFTATMIPPPDASCTVKFGRPPAPIGQTVTYGLDDALGRFQARIAPPPKGALAGLKSAIKRSPFFKPLLNMSPQRTAEALTRLASQPSQCSTKAVVQDLQGKMLERLKTLADAHGG